MSAIPSKLIMLRTLVNVPVSEYADIRPPSNALDARERLSFFKRLRQKPNIIKQSVQPSKQLKFNVAVWLRVDKMIVKPVSLWMSYKDASGENTILVDEQCIKDSTSAMFSGTVSFKAIGSLVYLRVCCAGVAKDEQVYVDEACVKRQTSELQITNSFKKMMAS